MLVDGRTLSRVVKKVVSNSNVYKNCCVKLILISGDRFIQQEIDGSSLVLLNYDQILTELKFGLSSAESLHNGIIALKAAFSLNKRVHEWTPEDVCSWVNLVTNSETNGERFIQQEIDGSSLIFLTHGQLLDPLNLKLGPSLKLGHALIALKASF